MGSVSHPLDPLTASEITCAAGAVRASFAPAHVRFCSISLREPSLGQLRAPDRPLPRQADVVLILPQEAAAFEVLVEDGVVVQKETLPEGTQPPFSPDDCFLAEKIVKDEIGDVVRVRYGIDDLELLACDPWSMWYCSKSAIGLALQSAVGGLQRERKRLD